MKEPTLNIISDAKKKKLRLSPYLAIAVAVIIVMMINQHTRLFMGFVTLVTATQIVYLAGFVIGGILGRIPIQEFSLYMGPELIRFYLGETKIKIGSLPFWSYVKLKGMGDLEDGEEPEANDFRQLPLVWRLSILLAPPLCSLVLASICIGSYDAWNSFLRGFYQYPLFSLQPLSKAQAVLESTAELLSNGSWVTLLGFLACKLAALNLLPLGGGCTNSLLQEFEMYKNSELRILKFYRTISTVIPSILIIGWVIAAAVYLYHLVR